MNISLYYVISYLSKNSIYISIILSIFDSINHQKSIYNISKIYIYSIINTNLERRNMNIRSYEYLAAIAEKGTLSGAARSLGMSQPALSNFLSSTEKELGHILFERNGRTMNPTKAGQIYLEACQKIIDIKYQTFRAISDITRQHSERFSVGVSPHRGSELFSDIYSDFYKRYPDIHVDLREGYMTELKSDIAAGKLTMALGSIIPQEQSMFGFSCHDRDELLLSVPLYHPLASLGSQSGPVFPTADIRRFRDTPFVMWGSRTTNYQIIDEFLKRNGITPVVLYESDNAVLIDKMLQKEISIGFLPTYYCRPNQNRVYFSFDPPLYSMLGVFFPPKTMLTQAQRYFIYLDTKHYIKHNPASEIWLNETAKSFIAEFEDA